MKPITSFLFLPLMSFAIPALAEESPIDNPADLRPTPVLDDDMHPVYCTDAYWAGSVVAAIAGLFVAAAVIGPIVRAEAPQAVPQAISHEEDPAADRH